MEIEELIADGWRRHDDDPQSVHDGLAQSVMRVSDEAQLRAFSRLLTHVHAEHLDNREAGISVLEQLRVRFEDEARAAYRPATTSIAILRFLDGDSKALTHLTGEERAGALATAASARAWHGQLDQALAAYERACEEGSEGLPAGGSRSNGRSTAARGAASRQVGCWRPSIAPNDACGRANRIRRPRMSDSSPMSSLPRLTGQPAGSRNSNA